MYSPQVASMASQVMASSSWKISPSKYMYVPPADTKVKTQTERVS